MFITIFTAQNKSSMVIFKKVVLFVSLYCMAVFGLNAQNNIVDQIVWVVGEEAILKSDVENTKNQMLLYGEKFEGDPYCFIPEQLAVNKLFLNQAKIDSIDVRISDVNRQVEAMLNQRINYVGSVERLEEYTKQTMAQMREGLREQVRDEEIVRQVQAKITADIKLTPSEIRNYYTQLPQDSLPMVPTTVEVQIITLNPVIPVSEIDAVKNKLRDFTDKINKKESAFSTLALMYSEDTESAKRGGELGFMGRAQLVPEYASAAFALNDPNKVSNVVQTEYGFHIIQLIEKRGDRANTRHILLKPKVPTEEITIALARMDSLANDIRIEKLNFDDAAAYLSFDKDTRNNKGIMVNLDNRSSYGGTSRFEMEFLPPEVGKVVDQMKVGDVSQAFTMKNNKGQEVIAIVKLRQRTPAHKANLSDDYQLMKLIVEEQKRNDVISNWVQEKIKTTYVRINDDWQNCDFKYKGWVK